MIRGKCPLCGKAFEVASLDQAPGFPFCSSRCRLVDLGRWIDGNYVLPDSAQPDPTQAPDSQEDDE